MRVVSFLAAAVFASSALAQRVTFTDPDTGNTVVGTVTTNAAGVPSTRPLSTITAPVAPTTTPVVPGGAVITTTDADGDPVVITGTRTSATLPTKTTATTKGGVKGIEAAPTTTYGPQSIITYDVNGVTYTWSNSFQSPEITTWVVPAGTIADFSQYQESVYSAAGKTGAADNKLANANGAIISNGGATGWTAMLVAAVGAGLGVYLV